MNQKPYRRHGDKAPIDRLLRPLSAFLGIEAISGAFPLSAPSWRSSSRIPPGVTITIIFLHTKIGVSFGEYSFQLSLLHWINDGLMTIFFSSSGFRSKREVVVGESPRHQDGSVARFGGTRRNGRARPGFSIGPAWHADSARMGHPDRDGYRLRGRRHGPAWQARPDRTQTIPSFAGYRRRSRAVIIITLFIRKELIRPAW